MSPCDSLKFNFLAPYWWPKLCQLPRFSNQDCLAPGLAHLLPFPSSGCEPGPFPQKYSKPLWWSRKVFSLFPPHWVVGVSPQGGWSCHHLTQLTFSSFTYTFSCKEKRTEAQERPLRWMKHLLGRHTDLWILSTHVNVRWVRWATCNLTRLAEYIWGGNWGRHSVSTFGFYMCVYTCMFTHMNIDTYTHTPQNPKGEIFSVYIII